MANKLIELSASGLAIATKEEIKTHLKSVISEAYGTDINFNPNYPDGIIVEALSAGFRDTFEVIQGLYNSFNIRNGSGIMLDSLSNLVNIHRKVKTQASGVLSLSLAIGINYSWTYFSVKDQNNNIWRSLDPVSEDRTAEVDPLVVIVNLVCDKYGEVEAPSSFIVLNPISSEGITVPSSLETFIQGSFDEDDISLRDRTINTPIRNSVSIKEQLVKLLLENKYIKSVKIYNNDNDANILLKLQRTVGTIEGVFLPPTQMAIIVQYNENLSPTEADKDVISKIIANYKGLCTITLDPDGQLAVAVIRSYSYVDPQNNDLTHDIFYIEAKKKTAVTITIDISEGDNYNSSTTQAFIITLIETYLGSLKVGEDLGVGSLMSYLYSNSDNQFLINSIVLAGASGTNQDEYYADAVDAGILDITISGV